ncbi:MAG: hypothetical protein ACM31O_03520 [Bacteroidota bacterium]
MTFRQRRHEKATTPEPEAVRGLRADHPALLNGRPLFSESIADEADVARIFISGFNNRKIGARVRKGAWAGMSIYTLTLPERTTCPRSCHMWADCYGNAMPFARRHAPGDGLEMRIARDIADLARKHDGGFVVRLHVLGDFYSLRYVGLWLTLMARHRELHIFGYSARLPQSEDKETRAIGAAITALNTRFPDRACIRFSQPAADANLQPGGAIVVNSVEEARSLRAIACPAETDDTACCATCGLCWSPQARGKTIAFLRHGLGASSSRAMASEASRTDADNYRRVASVPLIGIRRAPVVTPPVFLNVRPSELFVDETYQRSLTRSSMRLIETMVRDWDWRRFKPPTVAKDERGRLCVIDGQHTAIAAASHGYLETIPVMMVSADSIAERARAFIGQNRDRLAMSQSQIHHSAVVAGDADAVALAACCKAAGVRILKSARPSQRYQPGETVAVSAIARAIKANGVMDVTRALRLLAPSVAPITAAHLRAVLHLLLAPEYIGTVEDAALARAVAGLGIDGGLASAKRTAAAGNMRTWESLAVIYFRAAQTSLSACEAA